MSKALLPASSIQHLASIVITRDTIDEVKNRLDIVDVVGDFISLKRSGQNYKALSPFTNEKTPSFYVVPSKGIFKDFSSGKGGDAISFVMEHEGMSYLEAIRYLAKKYGVEIKEDEGRRDEELATQSTRESLYILMNYARDYYKDLLTKNEEGKSIGLSYFRERGFNDRTIEKFELGYSLNEWDHFTKAAVAKGYSEEMLEKAGLLIKKDDGKKYDRFRGRVIFPVHNLSGKVIAFGARILTKEKDQPKYINSPETEIYHKSNALYGMFQGKNAIRKEEFCYLVEGYTDVISMHQADIENVVASSGTALTEEQIKLMRRFTENVTVLYDGDAAGIKAALRGIDLVLKGGLNVRIVLLPDGEDPDSYSKKMGSTELKKYLVDHTQDFISFKIDLYSKEALKDPIKKAEAIQDIAETLSLLPDEIKRVPYYRSVAKLWNIDESIVIGEINKIRIARNRNKDVKDKREQVGTLSEIINIAKQGIATTSEAKVIAQEKETLRILLKYADNNIVEGKVSQVLLSELDDVNFLSPMYRKMIEEYRTKLILGESIDSAYFLTLDDGEIKNAVSELMIDKYVASPEWQRKFHIFFPKESEILDNVSFHNILLLKFRLLEYLIYENIAAMKDAELANNIDEFNKFFSIHERFKEAEMQLATTLGIVIPA